MSLPQSLTAPIPTAEDDANGAGVRRTSSKGDGST